MLVHVPRRSGQRVAVIGREGGAFSPLSLSPLAWWRFEDGSGETAVDLSGNGYDLTLANTPTWIAGHIGGALNFASASSEKGSTDAAGLLASLQGLSAFTVAFWARAAGYQAQGPGISIHNDVDANSLFLFYPYDTNGGNGVRIFYNGAAIIDQNAEPNEAPLDEWNHFAFVSRSATDHEAFVNNASAGTSSTSKSLAATLSDVTIGAWNDSQFFNGDIDEVLVIGRALSAGELTQLYQWAG